MRKIAVLIVAVLLATGLTAEAQSNMNQGTMRNMHNQSGTMMQGNYGMMSGGMMGQGMMNVLSTTILLTFPGPHWSRLPFRPTMFLELPATGWV